MIKVKERILWLTVFIGFLLLAIGLTVGSLTTNALDKRILALELEETRIELTETEMELQEVRQILDLVAASEEGQMYMEEAELDEE